MLGFTEDIQKGCEEMLEATIRFVGFMLIVAIGGAAVTLNYKNKWIPNIPYMIWVGIHYIIAALVFKPWVVF